mmetsp:Transcript_19795/g.30564  ORF Transcript_19795/g.30564 Transcript_19795/m.30564 type:complete len:200 (+) Transcript_19795:1879-2478(+)
MPPLFGVQSFQRTHVIVYGWIGLNWFKAAYAGSVIANVSRVSSCQSCKFASFFISNTLFVPLVPGFLEFLHFSIKGARRLFLVVDYKAIGKVEKVTGVALNNSTHLVCSQCSNRGSALTLSTVLPPCPERGETKLDSVMVCVRSKPWAENRLNIWMRETATGERLVRVQASTGAIGVAIVVWFGILRAKIVFQRVTERI